MSVIHFAPEPPKPTAKVVALYVSPLGPYPRLVRDWYDAKRDARTYLGPRPVVAHPPCGPWGPMRAFCTKQDRTLALDALQQVYAWGGVLEHPKGSQLWDACELPKPNQIEVDTFGGWTIEVNQVWFGHKCLKPTWVYICPIRKGRTLRADVASEVDRLADRKRLASHIIAGNARSGKPSASLRMRTLTPEPFAQWLISIARRCGR